MKLLIPIALCLSLVSVQAKDHEPNFQPAAGYAVGAVVLCVGGYCIYKMAKTCQKLFPKRSTNESSGFTATAGEEYAAAYEYSSIGSCYVPPDARPGVLPVSHNPTTFTLNVMLIPDGVLTSMSANSGEGTTQTWSEYQEEMVKHGLFLTGRATYNPQFSRDGVPCDGTTVPLSFEPFTGQITHNTGGELKRVTIERSPNMTEWAPLLVTNISDGTGFKVIDTTIEGQMFYRVSVSQP